MAVPSDVICEIDSNAVNYITDSISYASLGLIPAGAYKNKEYSESEVLVDESVEQAKLDLLYDPQTSGGLLISVPEEYADNLLEDFRNVAMDTKVSLIGKVKAYDNQGFHIHIK